MHLGAPYQPLPHLHPYYMGVYGYKKGDFPTAESLISHYTTLPMHVGISKEDAAYVVDTFLYALQEV